MHFFANGRQKEKAKGSRLTGYNIDKSIRFQKVLFISINLAAWFMMPPVSVFNADHFFVV